MSNTQRTRIGQIVGAFGLKGQLKVDPLTVFESRFDKGTTIWINDRAYRIEASQYHKGRPLIKLKGIDTMTNAELMQWAFIEAEGAPPLKDGDFLIEDLIGLEVVDEAGEILGEVEDVQDYPAHQVIVVADMLIPMVKEFVLNIDLEKRVMLVKLIPGMRGEEEEE